MSNPQLGDPNAVPKHHVRETVATAKEEDLADKLLAAAEKLAAVKLAADTKREDRAFWQAIVLAGLVAMPGIIAAWRINTTETKVDGVHKLVNSRLSELLEITKTSSRAEGVIEGRADKEKGK